MIRRALLALCLFAALPGCVTANVVNRTSLRPDYETVDKQQTKRIVIVVAPAPDQKPKVGEMWALMAKRYVHLKKQFIIKGTQVLEGAFNLQEVCKATLDKLTAETPDAAKLEAALWLEPKVKRVSEEKLEFDAAVEAKLLRCTDGAEVWTASGAGSWDGADPRAVMQSWDYAAEFGAEVGPYVAPAWNLLRPVLDTLPDPALNDADTEEKILSE